MSNQSANYGWIVIADHTNVGFNAEGNVDVGRVGPRGLTAEISVRLKNGEGRQWQAFDDDGVLYYEGLYLGPNDETMFRPLEDFATPNAGATTIKYLNAETGMWEAL